MSDILTLQICNANALAPDYITVHVDRSASVRQLKQLIQQSHPEHPPQGQMRLFYRGREFVDEEHLGTIEHENTNGISPSIPTMHMFVSFWVSESKHLEPTTTTDNRNCQGNNPASSDSGSVQVAHNTGIAENNSTQKASASSSTNKDCNGNTPGNNTREGVIFARPKGPGSIPHEDKDTGTSCYDFASGQQALTQLGPAFQYVLINNQPYLMEIPQNYYQRIPAQSNPLHPHDTSSLSISHSNLQHIINTLTMLSSRNTEAHDHPRSTQESAQSQDNANNAGQDAENEQPNDPDNAQNGNRRLVARVQFRVNINFSTLWNVLWLLLRIAFFVAMIAHDVNWERLALLAALAIGVFLWGGRRIPEPDQRIDPNRNQEQNEDREVVQGDHAANQGLRHDSDNVQEETDQQPLTLWSKARALLTAFVSSIIPNEPLRAPAIEDQ
ncbi:hypothetical protein H4219_000093 [Mycoemilia scoparia]|uniref:Ubiquitin-like domain-containing protein n=1 Tax=Mycoemilia scoparia TaxID=417184 RepID=A0A9W8A6Q7_9FUNG|nr:hypothetical protein H4219_000093 [Mycoemilia scoparia]